MDLLNQCNEKVTAERQDGSRHENVDALVTGKMILIPNARIPLAPGDSILRQLPSGLVEKLVVTDPGFYAPSTIFPTITKSNIVGRASSERRFLAIRFILRETMHA